LAEVLRHALDTSNNKYADIDEEDDFQVRICCGILKNFAHAEVLRHALDTNNNKYADIDEEDDFQVRICCGILFKLCAFILKRSAASCPGH
jgi:hypothetical protein